VQSIEGRVYYGPRGTDIVFDIRDNENFINVNYRQLQLTIGTVSIRLPRLTLDLNLNNIPLAASPEQTAVKQALAAHFAPNNSIAQVAALTQIDNQIYAIITEKHQVISNARLTQSLTTHHITATQEPNGLPRITSITTHP
jgi:hypothetical protein